MTMVISMKNQNVISKSRFKPKALHYFRQVENTGKPLIITDQGKPVLKIVPYSENPDETLKQLRGTVKKYEKPTQPVGTEDWNALK
jgi:prevent-host-death family protein